MREEIGVLLIEDENCEIAVQLFSKADDVRNMFKNLNGSPAEKPKRATLISIRYNDGKAVVSSDIKIFPSIESLEGRTDGYVLGDGPVTFK